jgi:hypothetical protein
VRTHPADKLLEQHWYKSSAGLLQLVRIKLTDDHYDPLKLEIYSFKTLTLFSGLVRGSVKYIGI